MIHTLHYQSPADDPLKVPVPHHIDSDDNVLRQDYWKGRPRKLIGFTAFPELGEVAVYGFPRGFLDRLVGMYPLFATHTDGGARVSPYPIERIEVSE